MWNRCAVNLACLVILGSGLPVRAQQPNAETTRGMLAAQIRLQGFTCDRPMQAIRDAKHSRPDHGVWVLKCDNAIYRVSRAPDMAAKVERLR
jgi:hypothetical protein